MKNHGNFYRISWEIILMSLLFLLLPCLAVGGSAPTAASSVVKMKQDSSDDVNPQKVRPPQVLELKRPSPKVLVPKSRVPKEIAPKVFAPKPRVPQNRAPEIPGTIVPKVLPPQPIVTQTLPPTGLDREILFKAAMQIKEIGFLTFPDGNWASYFSYKNTGTTIFEVGQLEFRSTLISKNGEHLPTETKTSPIKLMPGREHNTSVAWDRRSDDARIMVEIWYGNRRLNTATADVPPIQVAIAGNPCTHGIAVSNPSIYTVKVDYRIIPKSAPQAIGGGGPVAQVAIPDTTVIIPAQGTKSFPAITNLPYGFDIQILFWDERQWGDRTFVVLAEKSFLCPSENSDPQDPADVMSVSPLGLTPQ